MDRGEVEPGRVDRGDLVDGDGRDLDASDRPSRDSSDSHAAGYESALRFLYDRLNYEQLVKGAARYPFRLQRITSLLRELGLGDFLHADRADAKVPLVHIAGTKGKGSTAAMVAAILSSAGLRTGLYTSPHLHVLEERFRVDGQPCTRDDVISLVQRVQPATQVVQESIGPPSFFELTTAMALLHFDASRCDAIVLEVGLGGRLDSTNVCAPSVTAVTSIGLDHQHVLGDNVRAIAREKAGIFKPGIPVVSGVRDLEAKEVISSQAESQGAPLYQLDQDFEFDHETRPVWGSNVDYRGLQPPLHRRIKAALTMEGEHQSQNAAVAIAIVELLQAQGVEISDQAIRRGLGELQCEGRIERYVLPGDVSVIVDAAHNADSVNALCDCLRQRSADRPITVVFGTSIDKSAGPMLESLSEVASQFVLTRFLGNPRFMPPADLRPLVPPNMVNRTSVIEDPIEACGAAVEGASPGDMLVICGSFFLAAETRRWVADRAVHPSEDGDPPGGH